MYAYSHNGFNMRAIDPGMETPDEVVFDHLASPDEINAAFPGRISVAQAQIQATLTDAIQSHLDATAREHLYDGILSLASYAASSDPKWGAEGKAGSAWRDACWTHGLQVIADVKDGLRPIPTAAELVAELPALVWPAGAVK